MIFQQRQVQSLRGPRTATLSGGDPACVCVIRRAVTHDRDLCIFCFFPGFIAILSKFSLSAGVSAGCQPDIRHSVNGGDRWPCSPTDPDRRPSIPRWLTGSWRLAASPVVGLFDEPAIQRTPPPPIHSRHRPGENDAVGTAPTPPSPPEVEPPFLSLPRPHTCSWSWGRCRTGRTAHGRQQSRSRR
ncbi:hypothetical protein DSECCO2_557500 [anaerobic digester metagenome]